MFRRLYDKFCEWMTHDSPPREIPLCDFERMSYELRPCDVLLIEGRSRVSEVIKAITQSRWSHAVLYIGKLHDIDNPELRVLAQQQCDCDETEQLIIESQLGKGTVVIPLSTYRQDHIRICRPKGISRQDAQDVIAFALRHLEATYDVRHLVDLARLLLPWTFLPKHWRSTIFNYRPGIAMQVICSSLIAAAFNAVQFPIIPIFTKKNGEDGAVEVELFPRNPRLYTPSDFDYSPYFEIIKYPLFEVADKGHYRVLPWHEDTEVVSDDEGNIIRPNPLPEVGDKPEAYPSEQLESDEKQDDASTATPNLQKPAKPKPKTQPSPISATFSLDTEPERQAHAPPMNTPDDDADTSEEATASDLDKKV